MYILPVNSRNYLPLLVAGLLFACPGPLYAEYTLVLKNGRRITVESYREEGGMIKFRGLGGEVGINRGQVQSILKAGEPQSRGMSLSGTERPSPGDTTTGQEEKLEASKSPAGQAKGEGKEGGVAPGQDKVLSPEEKQAEEKAKEEKEYQRRVRQLTEQIKAARDRYLIVTRGTSGPEPTVPTTQEDMRTRADDLISRLRDVQQRQTGATFETRSELLQPTPLSGAPPPILRERPAEARPSAGPAPPGYTEKQRELSELRNQIGQLEKQRDDLIQEMKQKNFETGSLFLD
ncbi:hypothetical protein EPO44_03860 [bacterium]|nr:MAG: hypothetical protein EPO44_03860 [bacterium]